ncbi:unnamed protein product [Ixodes hexagonus]
MVLCSILLRKLVTGRLLLWFQQQRYMFTVRRSLALYKLERYNSWRRQRGLDPLYPPLYRMQRFVSRVLCASFCACCHGGRVNKQDFQGGGVLLKSLQPNSFENRVLKSFLGLCAGALLTVLLNLALQRVFRAVGALGFLVVLSVGTGLMLGSAFSSTVRCLTLLLLPQLFSKEGRMALLAYIYFLVLTGPSENFTANVEVLSRGLSCGQEKVANETRRMLDIATSPLKAVYDKIKGIIKVILDFGALMKKAFLSIKALFSEICKHRFLTNILNRIGAIRRAVQWLYNLVKVCNRRMGEPYEKCRKPLKDAHEDCLSMMPSILAWLCSPVKLVEYVCYVAKGMGNSTTNVFEHFCLAAELICSATNEGLPWINAGAEISGSRQIRDNCRTVLTLRRLSAETVRFQLFAVVLAATQYRFRYLREEDFDNYYVTWMVVAVDKSRARKGLETLLPLRSQEKQRFVEPFSPRMTKAELTDLAANLRGLAISAAYTAVAMLLDYTMFRLLSFVRTLGKINVNAGLPSQTRIHVEGTGPVADMYREVAGSLSPSSLSESMMPAASVQNCLLRPYAPDLDMYYWIGETT